MRNFWAPREPRSHQGRRYTTRLKYNNSRYWPYAKGLWDLNKNVHKVVKPWQDKALNAAGIQPLPSLFHTSHDMPMGRGIKRRGAPGRGYKKKLRKITIPRKPSVQVKEGGVKVSYKKRTTKKQIKWNRFRRKVQKAVSDNDQTHSLLEVGGLSAIITITGGGTAFDQAVYLNAANGRFDLTLGARNSTSFGLRRFIDDIRARAIVGVDTANTAITNVRGYYGPIDRTKLWVKYCVGNIGFSNPTAFNVVVDIYECVKKFRHETTSDLAKVTWDNEIAKNLDTTNPTPQTAWVMTRPANTTAGNTPYMCMGFGKYYKIVKKTSVIVGAGNKANYTYGLKPHMVTFDANSERDTNPIKDLILVCNPSQNEEFGSLQTLVTVEWNKQYIFKWVSGAPPLGGQSICGSYAYA